MVDQREALAVITELTDTVYLVRPTGIVTVNPWISKQLLWGLLLIIETLPNMGKLKLLKLPNILLAAMTTYNELDAVIMYTIKLETNDDRKEIR